VDVAVDNMTLTLSPTLTLDLNIRIFTSLPSSKSGERVQVREAEAQFHNDNKDEQVKTVQYRG